ncbi:MAG: glycosyltransferase [Opitutaceae bacterium]|jgi:glycosyltransferase involved in cell wall biosynthesis
MTPESQPFATVAICTYNRSRWLQGTLRFVIAQEYPADRWEILVIDNNSTDDTARVVEEFAGAAKAPRYVLEKTQGLSHARNRALAEALGSVVVFLDDDTDGDSAWLARLMSPYAMPGNEKVGIVGGEIIPGFPDGLPRWLEGQWEPLSYLSKTGPLPDNLLPMGANFSARRAAAQGVGGFRTDLGRTGDTLAGSEDHDFIRRVRSAGYSVWYVPEAVITHLIPKNRLTFRYAMKHAFDSSRSRVIERVARPGKGGAWLASRMIVYSLHVALTLLLSLLCFIFFQPGCGKRWLTRCSRSAGYLVEACAIIGRKLASLLFGIFMILSWQ